MKFLQFTLQATGLPITVNIAQITCFTKHYKSDGTVIHLSTDSEDPIIVEEPYEKVLQRVIAEEP